MSESISTRPNSKVVLPPIKGNAKPKMETHDDNSNVHQGENETAESSTMKNIGDSSENHEPTAPSTMTLHIDTPELKLEGSYHEESDIHESIPLTLTLPNGQILTRTIKIGDTVQSIKRSLLVEHSLPYEKVELCLEGRPMMDPLSLNDFPLIVERKAANLVAQVIREIRCLILKYKGSVQHIQMISSTEEKDIPTLMDIPPPRESEESALQQPKPENLEAEISTTTKQGWTETTKSPQENEEKVHERATFQNNITPPSVLEELPGIHSQHNEKSKGDEKETQKKSKCCTIV